MDAMKAGREAWQDTLGALDAERTTIERAVASLDAEGQALLAVAQQEDRDLTDAEQVRFDGLAAKLDAHNVRLAELRDAERRATE